MRLGTYYRAELLKLLNIKADKDHVVDVGCYDGYWLSTQSAKNKYGLDVNIIKRYPNINYIKANALNIPFENNKFDQVFAFDVIEHLPQNTEERFISELIRVAKNGGKIILFVPSKDIKIFPSFLTNWINKKWGHYKYNGLSKEEINEYLETFKNIKHKIIENNAQYYLRNYLFIRLLWRLNKAFTKKIVNRIAKNDFKNMEGNDGYYIIKILKQKS